MSPAISSPMSWVVSGSITTSARYSRARSAIVGDPGSLPSVFQASTLTEPSAPVGSSTAFTPRDSTTAPEAIVATATTAVLAASRPRIRRDGTSSRPSITSANTSERVATIRNETAWANGNTRCSPNSWGHSSTVNAAAAGTASTKPPKYQPGCTRLERRVFDIAQQL